jgi:hypothetical protein
MQTMNQRRKRVLSAAASMGGVIERAGASQAFTLADWEISERCRNAPPFIRRNIDAKREARGLRPLWGSRASGSARSQPAVVAAALGDVHDGPARADRGCGAVRQ